MDCSTPSAMPSSLRSRLGELAFAFASEIVDAIRSSSLQELLAQSSGATGVGRTAGHSPRSAASGRRGRLARRSESDIEGVSDRIATLLRKHRGGLRAEQIRQELGLPASELSRPLKQGLSSGRFSKTGRKRATVYFLKNDAGGKGGGVSKIAKRRTATRRKRAAEKPVERKDKETAASSDGVGAS
jgi:hypothetical protein